jgi:hypothetical protein
MALAKDEGFTLNLREHTKNETKKARVTDSTGTEKQA